MNLIYISLVVMFVLVLAEFWTMNIWKDFLRKEIAEIRKSTKNNEDLVVKSAQFTAELAERMESVEDYVRIIKGETENDKHADYWASVMNYNPFIDKEGEK